MRVWGSYRGRTGVPWNADPDQLGPPRLGLHNCKLVQIEGVQKLVMAPKKDGLFFPPPQGFERTGVVPPCQANEFPDLRAEHVAACLSFARDLATFEAEAA